MHCATMLNIYLFLLRIMQGSPSQFILQLYPCVEYNHSVPLFFIACNSCLQLELFLEGI